MNLDHTSPELLFVKVYVHINILHKISTKNYLSPVHPSRESSEDTENWSTKI